MPSASGVYAVIRPLAEPVEFLSTSTAGHFKGKDPTVPVNALQSAWVDGVEVLYIGKAGAGSGGERGLRKRLDEYRRHGQGRPVGHWGGRYIWQLTDSASLLVAWLATPDEDPADVEADLIAQFTSANGKRPFANRNRGRGRSSLLEPTQPDSS